VKYNLVTGYPTLIASSISTVDSNLVSNLTLTQINTIVTNVGALGTTMNTRRTHDENFYANCNIILEQYNEMKKYKSPGTSETNIINDYIGTTRLKNNLANTA